MFYRNSLIVLKESYQVKATLTTLHKAVNTVFLKNNLTRTRYHIKITLAMHTKLNTFPGKFQTLGSAPLRTVMHQALNFQLTRATDHPTNTPRVFHVEYMWCVYRELCFTLSSTLHSRYSMT